MSRQRLIKLTSNLFRFSCVLIIFFLFPANVFSQETEKRIKGPIVVTSVKLTADNKNSTALFEKNVIARTTDMTMYSDRMLVYYESQTGNVTRIDADGSVKVVKEDRVITSQKAVYFADGNKVIFTGEPRAIKGENIVTGKVMTYLMDDDLFLVEESKVFLSNKKEE